ncbi:hypothetical protein M3231_01935 [Neobacillus mesonae]|nr:hypothetical protein [Neobacillus mesonae]
MKTVPILMILIIFLKGCSSSPSAPPDEIVKTSDSVTAVKTHGEYELRLSLGEITRSSTNLKFQARIRYVGSKPELEIMHSFNVLRIDLQIDGKSLLPPSSSPSIGLTSILKRGAWLEETIEIPITNEQLDHMLSSDGEIVLYADFNDGQTKIEDSIRSMRLRISEVFEE